jgi:hypothetical protein
MALNQTPSSQKYRPIEFVLDDQVAGTVETVSLVIRPEDLTRAEPSRLSAQQTLGGAWVDNFGPGIANITIAGHTGWRGTSDGAGDGMDRFQKLNRVCFQDWHLRRDNAVKAGEDPDRVKLIFADSLDRFAWVVAPGNFTLKRNKSRPLLLQYQMNLIVLDTKISQAKYIRDDQPSADERTELGLDSLNDAVARLQEWSDEITELFEQYIGAPVREFTAVTSDVLGTVSTVVSGIKGAVDKPVGAFLSTAADLSAAARNIYLTQAQVVGLPYYAKFRAQQVAATYNNAFCLLHNAFRIRKFFPDYSWLYGASTCSSTNGGVPLAPYRHLNAFDVMTPITGTQSYVQVSDAADGAMQNMALADPALAPPSNDVVRASVRDIAAGVTVA